MLQTGFLFETQQRKNVKTDGNDVILTPCVKLWKSGMVMGKYSPTSDRTLMQLSTEAF